MLKFIHLQFIGWWQFTQFSVFFYKQTYFNMSPAKAYPELSVS